MAAQQIIRCPRCGLTAFAPSDAPLPEEGPTCATGHPEVAMVVVTTAVNEG